MTIDTTCKEALNRTGISQAGWKDSVNSLSQTKLTLTFEELQAALLAHGFAVKRTEQLDGPVSYFVFGEKSADCLNSLSELKKYIENLENESIGKSFERLRDIFSRYELVLRRTDQRDGVVMYWVQVDQLIQRLHTVSDANRFLQHARTMLQGQSGGHE